MTRVRTTWVPGDDTTPRPSVASVASVASVTPEDPDRVLVRRLLSELRADFVDPMRPAPKVAPGSSVTLPMRTDRAPWEHDLPRGFVEHPTEPPPAATLEVLDHIRALPDDARVVSHWLRDHATLEDGASGLRGLFVDVALAFATSDQAAAWHDLSARRAGAPSHGRRLVLATARAWGLVS